MLYLNIREPTSTTISVIRFILSLKLTTKNVLTVIKNTSINYFTKIDNLFQGLTTCIVKSGFIYSPVLSVPEITLHISNKMCKID